MELYVWDTELTVPASGHGSNYHPITERPWRVSDGRQHPVVVIKLGEKKDGKRKRTRGIRS